MDLLINPRLRELLCFHKRKDIYGKVNTEIYQVELAPAEYYLLLRMATNEKIKYKELMEYMSNKLGRSISYSALRQYIHRLRSKGIDIKAPQTWLGIRSNYTYQLKDEVWFR